ncbi:MAG: hypothetical protein H7Z40_10555, partial [Phycisphaerae bacterium]|nr:hypothetical protein [Gemmatimonadaceae bacterium]
MHFDISTIFTQSRRQPSDRLRLLARALQGYGIAIGVATVGLALYKLTAPDSQRVAQFDGIGALQLAFGGVLRSVSLLVISRSLLRRQRWGAYLAVVTLTVPLLRAATAGQSMGAVDALASIAALGTLVTVWKELRPARELDLLDDEDFEKEPPTKVSFPQGKIPQGVSFSKGELPHQVSFREGEISAPLPAASPLEP